MLIRSNTCPKVINSQWKIQQTVTVGPLSDPCCGKTHLGGVHGMVSCRESNKRSRLFQENLLCHFKLLISVPVAHILLPKACSLSLVSLKICRFHLWIHPNPLLLNTLHGFRLNASYLITTILCIQVSKHLSKHSLLMRIMLVQCICKFGYLLRDRERRKCKSPFF